MAVNGVNNSSSTPRVVDANKTGFAGLTSQDFMKLLIAQLQNQDPTNPLDSDQLLNQISEMRSLQANLELEDSLKSLTLSQALTSSTSFIGKKVTAIVGADKQNVSGVVDRVVVKDGKTYLSVAGKDVSLSELQTVAP